MAESVFGLRYDQNHHACANVVYTFLFPKISPPLLDSLAPSLSRDVVQRGVVVQIGIGCVLHTPEFALPSSGEFRERSSPVPPPQQARRKQNFSDVIFSTPCVRAQIPDWKLGQFSQTFQKCVVIRHFCFISTFHSFFNECSVKLF